MGSHKWMSFLAHNILDDEYDYEHEHEEQPPNPFLPSTPTPPPPPPLDLADCSGDNECSNGESVDEQDKIRFGKRYRGDSWVGGSKAYREKRRRDRLNDRFLELSAILDPDRPPNPDKVAILSDAIRILKQLKAESQHLRDGNSQLREAVKELKMGKSELRDEKLVLRSEKEKLEQQLKCTTMPPGLIPHPAALFHPAATSFASQNQAASFKAASLPGYPAMAMWQWLPPAAVDTSQDRLLRPPVARLYIFSRNSH